MIRPSMPEKKGGLIDTQTLGHSVDYSEVRSYSPWLRSFQESGFLIILSGFVAIQSVMGWGKTCGSVLHPMVNSGLQ